MDYDNMMLTPVMYQDIPTSYGMNCMPMCGMPMYGYPMYGVSGLKPVPVNDKFEKLQNKDKETKNSLKKAGIAAGILTLAGIGFAIWKKKNIGPALKNCWNAAKTHILNGFNKVKNWFKPTP